MTKTHTAIKNALIFLFFLLPLPFFLMATKTPGLSSYAFRGCFVTDVRCCFPFCTLPRHLQSVKQPADFCNLYNL